jgi:ABC-type proline/glycine betaine transport system substrate-binding protein
VDLQNKSLDDVAAAWVDANQDKWKAWVSTPAN